MAATEIFPMSVSLQKKGCPRGAFLGLCEDGLVSVVLGKRVHHLINDELGLKLEPIQHFGSRVQPHFGAF